MSWQHLNQPQGWIGVISLSLSLSHLHQKSCQLARENVIPTEILQQQNTDVRPSTTYSLGYS